MTIGSLTTGATQGGAITQIVARGAADFHLTGAATVTYWRLKHSTHTNFATEPIQQAFTNTVAFGGGTATITLNRTGDLIFRQYIVIDLPGIAAKSAVGVAEGKFPHRNAEMTNTAASTTSRETDYNPDNELAAGLTNPLGGFYCHWVNAVGFALLKAVRLIVGGHVIDTLYSDYLYMYEELTGKAGKRLMDMVGKHESREQLIAYSRHAQRLYVPLPFWYSQVAGNALSLVSLAFHGVQLAVDFQELKKLIVISNPDVTVYKTTASAAKGGGSTLSSAMIADNDLQACVQTEYVYLDVSERNRFAEGLFDQLIHTVQCHQSTGSTSTMTINLLFNHPVMQLIFAARLNVNDDANDQFNYSRCAPADGGIGATAHASASVGGTPSGYNNLVPFQPQTEGTFDILTADEGADTSVNVKLISDDAADAGAYVLGQVVQTNADPFTSVGLRVNNLQRFAPMSASYFRQVQPYQHHSSIPQGYIYTYSFALHPEEPNPSGALNWSRLDSVVMDLGMHGDMNGNDYTVIVYARNWNVFSYVDGIGGNKFQS